MRSLTKKPKQAIVNIEKSSLRNSFRSSTDLRWVSLSQMKDRKDFLGSRSAIFTTTSWSPNASAVEEKEVGKSAM